MMDIFPLIALIGAVNAIGLVLYIATIWWMERR